MDPLYLPTANLGADNMIRLFVLRSYVNRLGVGVQRVGLLGFFFVLGFFVFIFLAFRPRI